MIDAERRAGEHAGIECGAVEASFGKGFGQSALGLCPAHIAIEGERRAHAAGWPAALDKDTRQAVGEFRRIGRLLAFHQPRFVEEQPDDIGEGLFVFAADMGPRARSARDATD